jgi:hypothetical protein
MGVQSGLENALAPRAARPDVADTVWSRSGGSYAPPEKAKAVVKTSRIATIDA